MEPIFENVTVETEQLLQRAFSVLAGKKYIVQYAVFGIAMLLAFAQYVWWREFVWLCLTAVYAYFLCRRIYQYTTYGKRSLRSRLAYYDNMNPPMTNRFFEDRVVSQDIDSVNITYYTKISRVDFCSDLIVLYRKNGGVILLDPQGFTKGDYDSFTHFIREKIPHPTPAPKQ